MSSPPNAHTLLAAYGLRPKKSWGQNFLCDETVLTRIADACGLGPQSRCVELGAGLGALTYHLLTKGGQVLAVERDREIVPILKDALGSFENLEVTEGDAAKVDYAAFAAKLGGPLVVAGNLPYQISSRLMVSLADAKAGGVPIERGVLMVQKEVAERASAEPGTKAFGLLSVLVQRVFDVQQVLDVPPGAFLPPPKVTSRVVLMQPKARPLATADGLAVDGDFDRDFVRIARAAFSQKRKTLKNALKGGLGLSADATDALLQQAGVEPTRRAETLPLSAFVSLTQAARAQNVLDNGPQQGEA